MALLFDCSTDNIGLHLKNIYETGELTLQATTENFSVVQTVAKKVQQVGKYTKETGLNRNTMKKLVLQLASNAGSDGFKRADAFEIMEHSLPANMTNTQKLSNVSNMLRAMHADGFLIKSESGKSWFITDLGRVELES